MTFSVRGTFFPSFDTEIFLNRRISKHRQGKTEEQKKTKEMLLLLLFFFLRLLHFSFLLPLVVCLFEEERRKMEDDDGFGGRRRRASPSSPATMKKKKKKTSSSSSLLPLLLRIFFLFIFGVVVLFGVVPALLTKNRLLSSKSFSNPFINHHQNNDFVPELTCGAKVVENINEEYLHDVLTELSNQTFFRLFRVDLTRECKFWQNWQNGIKGGGKEGKEEEEGSCSAPPASFGNGKAKPSEDGLYFEESNDKKEVNADVLPKTTMCSLSTEPAGFDDIFGSSSSSSASSSKASIPRAPFSDPVDTTITSKEDKTTSFIDEEDCSKNQTSPKFWLDICTAPENKDTRKKIEEEEEEHSSYVNLRLNPERWTGYNGSHVWKAIYEENCLKGEKKEDGLCYEERVLYRLLSGMHASVNIHVALHANPPQSKDEEWLPDPARFAQLFENHPERLKNLHFSFVVMLRALRKATPALAKFPTDLGQDTIEDEKTRQLKMKLLDSPQVLGKSCEELFNAFDEARLFNDVGVASEVLVNSGGSDKVQFKDIFRNITEVIDCVACQKCRLHGKLQILGIGTALKILLLPEEVLMNEDVITRSEFVAMINTIAKFSRALMASSHFAKTKNLAL